MANDKFELLSEDTAYDGFNSIEILNFKYRKFNGGQSNVIERELFRRKSYVGVLLYDPKRQEVILIEQFRIGPMVNNEHPWLLEIVAGMVDDEENNEQAVMREAIEEANCTITKLIPIDQYYLTPGSSNETLTLYCGITDTSKAGGIYGLATEDEDIKVHVISFDAVISMLKNNEIKNASTIIAVQWLALNYHILSLD